MGPQKIEVGAITTYYGSVEEFDKSVKAHLKAIKDHAKTVNVPAPTADPLIERVVRIYGGEYEIVYPPEPEPVVEPKLSFDETKAKKYAELARYRQDAEYAGIEYAGVRFRCNTESLVILSEALAASGDNEHYIYNWKIGPGEFRQLKRAALAEILDMVRKRVQTLFDLEYEYSEKISKARGFIALNAIELNQGWAE